MDRKQKLLSVLTLLILENGLGETAGSNYLVPIASLNPSYSGKRSRGAPSGTEYLVPECLVLTLLILENGLGEESERGQKVAIG